MVSSVRATDIQNRLRTLSELQVSTQLVESKPYLPAADAYFEKLADRNGSSYDDLTTSEKILADQIIIAMTCKKIIMSAPLPGLEAGAIRIKSISAEEKQTICSALQTEIDEAIEILGWTLWKKMNSYYLSDDYMPDGEDLTNLLFLDEEETEISIWR